MLDRALFRVESETYARFVDPLDAPPQPNARLRKLLLQKPRGSNGHQPGHRLVTRRVYGVIRHPSYLGLLISSLGWGLAFRSGIGVLLAALLVPPLLARMEAEENLLRSQFGDEYDAYRARTSWLIPELY
jgi:protein-S-isoprenylcysteine O-methyltransferase Ste14